MVFMCATNILIFSIIITAIEMVSLCGYYIYRLFHNSVDILTDERIISSINRLVKNQEGRMIVASIQGIAPDSPWVQRGFCFVCGNENGRCTTCLKCGRDISIDYRNSASSIRG